MIVKRSRDADRSRRKAIQKRRRKKRRKKQKKADPSWGFARPILVK